MKFGEALEACKEGKSIARRGWNGKRQFVFLIKAKELRESLKYGYGEQLGEPTITDTLAIKTSNNQIQIGWLATQSDMLSNDWYVLGSKNMYRRKPNTITALQWKGKIDTEMYTFLTGEYIIGEVLSKILDLKYTNFELEYDNNQDKFEISVKTKNGYVRVNYDDYIIKGEDEYYPCNRETFEKLYEKAYNQ